MKNRWLRALLTGCTSLFQIPFRLTQFNKVVQVNNKPCDAILYPEMSLEEVKMCVKELTNKFPKHAILFPRIDKLTHPTLFDSLEKCGFLMVPTRPVHVFHPESSYMKKSHTKRDFSFLRKQNIQFVSHEEIASDDLPRIQELYQKLFIEKYGHQNPNLTLQFFQESHANHWYTFFGLRNDKGVIDAFLSYETEGKSMACGPLGYDTEKDQVVGLYRMIFAHSLKIARESDYLFNFGGGNEHFKLKRGSQREIAFTAVYCPHLPLWRRFPWLLLGKLGKNLTLKLMKSVLF